MDLQIEWTDLDDFFFFDALLNFRVVTALYENAFPLAAVLVGVAAFAVHEAVLPLAGVGWLRLGPGWALPLAGDVRAAEPPSTVIFLYPRGTVFK